MSAEVPQTGTAAEIAEDLSARDDVENAVSEWDDCDVAVVVTDGTDIRPIRRGLQVEDVQDFDAAPYTLLKLSIPSFPTEMDAEEFATATPDVPADRIDCERCGREYIGDASKGSTCPPCKAEQNEPVVEDTWSNRYGERVGGTGD